MAAAPTPRDIAGLRGQADRACTDVEQLDGWLARAFTATTARGVLREPLP
jgi:hypothetical protein